MYIFIASDGRLALRDSDNMRAFSVVEEESGIAGKWLAPVTVSQTEQDLWLDANAVIELSGRIDDQAWVESFWDMLAGVEAYGYSDMQIKRVRAHVEKN